MIGKLKLFAVVLLTSILPLSAEVITYGSTTLGINPTAQLNFDGIGPGGFGTYGVYRAGVGDAISPGCPCEGWGVSAVAPSVGATSVYFNNSTGSGGFASDGTTYGFTSSTFTSNVTMAGAPVTVQHLFGPSIATDIFQVQVTITNGGTAAINDLTYRRVMDWDVPPTAFAEYVTHSGVTANLTSNGGNVRFASDNGFATADPLVPAGSIFPSSINTDFIDLGPGDHGSVFDFAFGTLEGGKSRIFNIFYGSASDQETALTNLERLGVDLFSLGQNSTPSGPTAGTPATFVFAFGGVGGAATEPGLTPENPLLPFVPAEGGIVYNFPDPPPARWFDPPLASGFTYELTGGALFSEVRTPFGPGFPTGTVGLYDPFDSLLALLAPGESYIFSSPAYSKISIRGISPLIDAADPTLYPTFLDWTGTASLLTMTPIVDDVPEPASFTILAIGLLALGGLRRRALRCQ